jgi:TP901 family phage tail tape measure protein
MAAFTIPSVFTAVDKFSGPVRSMANAAQSFAEKAEVAIARADRGFRKLSGGLISETSRQFMSFASTAAVAAAIVGGASFSVKSLKDYETAVQSFRTIVSDASDQEFAAYREQINLVAKDTRRSSIEVAQSFEKIAGLNATFAETADGLAAVSNAAIVLAKASGMELGASAENLVGIMNQFAFSADEADRAINVLAAGQAVGAANIEQTAEAFKNFGATAKGANITLEESVGLIQTLGKFSIFGAEAGTKLRGAVSKLQEAGVGYASGQFNVNDALAEAKARIDKLTDAKAKDEAISKMFGMENKNAGLILLNNIQTYKDYTTGVTGTSEASKAAAINSSTLAVRIEELKAAWVNMLTSSDAAGGSLGAVKNVIGFVTDNLNVIVGVLGTAIAVFAAWKIGIVASQIALGAYNIVLGISNALSTTSVMLTSQNALAQKAYLVTTKLMTAGLWLYDAAVIAVNVVTALWTANFAALNVIMAANPIGLIIGAVVILTALVVAIIAKWQEWGATLAIFLGPLGFVISLIQSFRRNWDMLVQAFQTGGIIGALKAIGKIFIDAILMPLQQLLEIAAKLPGKAGEWAATGADKIEQFRNTLGVNTTTDENGNPLPAKEAINPKQVEQDALVQRMEKTNTSSVNVNFNDPGKMIKNISGGDDLIGVQLSSTSTWSQ